MKFVLKKINEKKNIANLNPDVLQTLGIPLKKSSYLPSKLLAFNLSAC